MIMFLESTNFYSWEEHLAQFQGPVFDLIATSGGLSLGKAMGESLELGQLAAAWDETDTIREKLRSGMNLLESKPSNVDSSISECKCNQDVLTPMLHRFMAAKLKLPEIGGLRYEIETVYKKNMQNPEESTIDDNAWDLRKMLRFIKRKSSRGDPSTDLCKHLVLKMMSNQI
jgi:hypothetical protein